ncbi:unnamed protein product, partial [marine sediment metagenome]
LQGGATTLWEHWEFSDNTYSHNHPMFGSVSAWFYESLAGIRPHPEAVGFDRIVTKPKVAGGVTWVKAHYDSVRGRVKSHWSVREGRFYLDLAIPVGTTATVYIPAERMEDVLEGTAPAENAEGVRFLRMEDGAAVFEVDSGSYTFVATRVRD